MKTGVFFMPEDYAKLYSLAEAMKDTQYGKLLKEALRCGCIIHDADVLDGLQECEAGPHFFNPDHMPEDYNKDFCPDCQPFMQEPEDKIDYDAVTPAEECEKARQETRPSFNMLDYTNKCLDLITKSITGKGDSGE